MGGTFAAHAQAASSWLPVYERIDVAVDHPGDSFDRKVRPFFVCILGLQAMLCGFRAWLGDIHGALLMFAMVLLGVLGLSFHEGVEVLYCQYYGMVAFVSGVLDASLALEIWGHNVSGKNAAFHGRIQSPPLALIVLLYLTYAISQLAGALVSWLVVKDAQDTLDAEEQNALYLTPEDASIYGTAIMYTTTRAGAGASSLSEEHTKAFSGKAQKLDA